MNLGTFCPPRKKLTDYNTFSTLRRYITIVELDINLRNICVGQTSDFQLLHCSDPRGRKPILLLNLVDIVQLSAGLLKKPIGGFRKK
jgi:hypothetical protein